MKCLSIFNLKSNPCHSQSFAPRFGTHRSPSQDTAKALRAAATGGALSQRMWNDAVRSRKPPKGVANCSGSSLRGFTPCEDTFTLTFRRD